LSRKVVVGMSGGVDSSVAAWLLKEQGYDVIGVTMQIWQDEDTLVQEAEGGCCGLSAVDDARRVAMDLGIPYYVMNFKNEFRTQVMDYFAAEYMAGRTPNPCIACNRYVKCLCFAAVFPLEQITLLPDIMRGSNSFQTADMPLKSQ
jgi:tRNA-specific 2-thiouridylase